MPHQRDKRLWIAPKIWPGNECYILGGGPSLKEFDIKRLRGKRIIAVNMAYKFADWIDVLYFGDCRWLRTNAEGLNKFAGLKITTCGQYVGKPGIKVISKINTPGLSTDPKNVVWNLSSGACAINLATHFGVKKIILLGFDMHAINDKHHWHEYYERIKKNAKHDPYNRFMGKFGAIAKSLKTMGVECVNACSDSSLEVFPKIALEDI